MFSDWDHACGLAHVVRQPHYGGEVALNHDLAVKAERGGYHLRLDERIAVLVPPTQEPNSRTRPNRGVYSRNWRTSSSSNSL